jgi:hypothetical protein
MKSLVEIYKNNLIESDEPNISPSSVKYYPATDIDSWESISNLKYTLSKVIKNGDINDWAKSVNIDDPIDLKITKTGQGLINDGKHRVLAARILGKKVAVNLTTDLNQEVFNKFIDRINRGFTLKEINPGGWNLNGSYYKIPDLEVMSNVKGKNLTQEQIENYYIDKAEGNNSELVKKIENV